MTTRKKTMTDLVRLLKILALQGDYLPANVVVITPYCTFYEFLSSEVTFEWRKQLTFFNSNNNNNNNNLTCKAPVCAKRKTNF